MIRNLLFFDYDHQLYDLYRDTFHQQKNFCTFTTSDLTEATEIVGRIPLELIVVSRPDRGPAIQDALRFATQAVRAKRRVLLMSSAYNDKYTMKHELEETGAREALVKPFGATELTRIVNRMISQKITLKIPDRF